MDRVGSEGPGQVPQASSGNPNPGKHDLVPREYLRIIAVWSLVPSYALAGGLLGYAADRWLKTFPYLTALGLLLALALAVRDMYRLRDTL
jgi:hypothetical protein